LILKGVHGTTRAAALKIVQQPTFQISATGRIGAGVYCWRESIYAKDLANCWYEYRVRKGDYQAAEGVILRAEIRLDENDFLDLEHPSYKDALSPHLTPDHPQPLLGKAGSKHHLNRRGDSPP